MSNQTQVTYTNGQDCITLRVARISGKKKFVSESRFPDRTKCLEPSIQLASMSSSSPNTCRNRIVRVRAVGVSAWTPSQPTLLSPDSSDQRWTARGRPRDPQVDPWWLRSRQAGFLGFILFPKRYSHLEFQIRDYLVLLIFFLPPRGHSAEITHISILRTICRAVLHVEMYRKPAFRPLMNLTQLGPTQIDGPSLDREVRPLGWAGLAWPARIFFVCLFDFNSLYK